MSKKSAINPDHLDQTGSTSYRPASLQDYKEYTKSLSQLSEVPLSALRNLVAKIYGYRDEHQLSAELKSPGKPGPFNFPGLIGHVHSEGTLYVSEEIAEVRMKRASMLIAEAGNAYGLLLEHLDAVDLFGHPAEQRRTINLLQKQMDSGKGSLYDYVDVVKISIPGIPDSVTFQCTSEGIRVNEKLMHLRDRVKHATKQHRDLREIRRDLAEMKEITREHSGNPVAHALMLDAVFIAFRLDRLKHEGEDDENTVSEDRYFVSIEAISQHGNVACELFRSLLMAHGSPSLGSLEDVGTLVKSAFYHNAVLHFNCDMFIAAANIAGELLKMNPDDDFGARYYYSASMIARGRAGGRKVFPKQTITDPWPELVGAVEAAIHSDYESAAKQFSRACELSWHVVEAFSGTKYEAQLWGWGTKVSALERIEHFIEMGDMFWSGYKWVTAFFKTIVNDPGFRVEVHHYSLHRLEDKDTERTVVRVRSDLLAAATEVARALEIKLPARNLSKFSMK